MSTSGDFKAVVDAAVGQGGVDRLPGRGEVVLLGQTSQGQVVRMRIPGRFRWFEALIARGFVKERKIDRLALIVLEGSDQRTRRLRVLLITREEVGEPDSTDPRVARLARAVRREWSGEPQPLLSVAGRPWPIGLLAVALFLDLMVGAERLALALAGDYQWIPQLPPTPSLIAYVGYLVLVAVTIHQLWQQTRAGYVLGIAVAGVQLLRTALLAPLEYTSHTGADFAWWLTLALLFPALIAVCFLTLYQAQRRYS